jgi:hypothetical protein
MAKLSALVLALLTGDAAARVAAVSGAQATQVKYPELKANDPKNPTTKEYVDYMSLLMEKKLFTSFMGEPEASKKAHMLPIMELTRC